MKVLMTLVVLVLCVLVYLDISNPAGGVIYEDKTDVYKGIEPGILCNIGTVCREGLVCRRISLNDPNTYCLG